MSSKSVPPSPLRGSFKPSAINTSRPAAGATSSSSASRRASIGNTGTKQEHDALHLDLEKIEAELNAGTPIGSKTPSKSPSKSPSLNAMNQTPKGGKKGTHKRIDTLEEATLAVMENDDTLRFRIDPPGTGVKIAASSSSSAAIPTSDPSSGITSPVSRTRASSATRQQKHRNIGGSGMMHMTNNDSPTAAAARLTRRGTMPENVGAASSSSSTGIPTHLSSPLDTIISSSYIPGRRATMPSTGHRGGAQSSISSLPSSIGMPPPLSPNTPLSVVPSPPIDIEEQEAYMQHNTPSSHLRMMNFLPQPPSSSPQPHEQTNISHAFDTKEEGRAMMSAVGPSPSPSPSSSPIDKNNTLALPTSPTSPASSSTLRTRNSSRSQHPAPTSSTDYSLDRSWWWSILTLSFLNPILSLGNRIPLQNEHIPLFSKNDEPAVVVHKLQSAWKRYTTPSPSSSESTLTSNPLFLTLCSCYKYRFLIGSLTTMLGRWLLIVTPLFIKEFLIWIKSDSHASGKGDGFFFEFGSGGIGYGLGIILVLFLILIIASVSVNHSYYQGVRMGSAFRTALMSMIYEKALRCGSGGGGSSNRAPAPPAADGTTAPPPPPQQSGGGTGQTVNLMANDTQQLFDAATLIHFTYVEPLLIIGTVIVLYYEIGVAALPAGGLMLLLFPVQILVAKKIGQNRSSMVKYTDSRVKILSEILQGIRVIKLYAWELPMAEKVQDIRVLELKCIQYALLLKAFNLLTLFLWPVFVSMVTFIVYVSLDNRLTIIKAIEILSFVNVLSRPITVLPMALIAVAEVRVSMRRIELFLGKKELESTSLIVAGRKSTGGGTMRGIGSNGENTEQQQQKDQAALDIIVSPSSDHSPATPDANANNTAALVAVLASSNTSDASLPGGRRRSYHAVKPSVAHSVASRNDVVVEMMSVPSSAGQKGNGENSRDSSPQRASASTPVITVLNGSFTYDASLPSLALSQINVSILPGKLIAVIGSVGSGKSSLFNAFLGEISCVTGSVSLSGRIAYMSQSSWIQNASVKNNILFGLPYNKERYERALEAACLVTDMKLLPGGDSTEIGERGINLSGGQKSRISLARAIYRKEISDIYLLDDPFAAVDVSTGSLMFHQACLEELQGKTRVLILNSHLHLLKYFEEIWVMQSEGSEREKEKERERRRERRGSGVGGSVSSPSSPSAPPPPSLGGRIITRGTYAEIQSQYPSLIQQDALRLRAKSAHGGKRQNGQTDLASSDELGIMNEIKEEVDDFPSELSHNNHPEPSIMQIDEFSIGPGVTTSPRRVSIPRGMSAGRTRPGQRNPIGSIEYFMPMNQDFNISEDDINNDDTEEHSRPLTSGGLGVGDGGMATYAESERPVGTGVHMKVFNGRRGNNSGASSSSVGIPPPAQMTPKSPHSHSSKSTGSAISPPLTMKNAVVPDVINDSQFHIPTDEHLAAGVDIPSSNPITPALTPMLGSWNANAASDATQAANSRRASGGAGDSHENSLLTRNATFTVNMMSGTPSGAQSPSGNGRKTGNGNGSQSPRVGGHTKNASSGVADISPSLNSMNRRMKEKRENDSVNGNSPSSPTKDTRYTSPPAPVSAPSTSVVVSVQPKSDKNADVTSSPSAVAAAAGNAAPTAASTGTSLMTTESRGRGSIGFHLYRYYFDQAALDHLPSMLDIEMDKVPKVYDPHSGKFNVGERMSNIQTVTAVGTGVMTMTTTSTLATLPPSNDGTPSTSELEIDAGGGEKENMNGKDGVMIGGNENGGTSSNKNALSTLQPSASTASSTKPASSSALSTTSRGLAIFFSLLLLFIFCQILRIGCDLWLTLWGREASDATSKHDQGLSGDSYDDRALTYWIFGCLIVTSITCTFVAFRAWIFVRLAIRISTVMHHRLFHYLLHAPITTYFDITPLGRILNNFSKDMDQVDSFLPDLLSQFLQHSINLLGGLILAVVSTPYYLAVLLPIFYAFYSLQKYFRHASRELKRLEGVSRSPIFSKFSETLGGLATIRAYRVQTEFIQRQREAIRTNSKIYSNFYLTSRWLGLRLDLISNFLVLAVGLFGVFLRRTIDPALIGLALMYTLQFTGFLQWTVRVSVDTENAMTAVERLSAYHSTPSEAAYVVPASQSAPSSWPSRGEIIIRDLTLKYRPELPYVLKGISVHIKPREKIGICGRTGSGKSSLMIALFRIVESEQPRSIIIDGIDIGQIGLRELRSAISIIPQDAQLFSGTIRYNLDPFNERSEESLWRVLRQVSMESYVMQLQDGLDAAVHEYGENYSSGQRQLICIARALLRQSRIIVLDEATAAVDNETDALIQKTIKESFADCTVLTIAHRLNTIMDSTRVMVLDAGHLVEFDTPANLMKSGGHFATMVNTADGVNQH